MAGGVHRLARAAPATWLQDRRGSQTTILRARRSAGGASDRPVGRFHRPRTCSYAEPHRIFLGPQWAGPPARGGSADVVVSGLVLEFHPRPVGRAPMSSRRPPRADDRRLVWDYAEKMEPIRAFWDAAIALDPAARPPRRGARFPRSAPPTSFAPSSPAQASNRNRQPHRPHGQLHESSTTLDAVPEWHRPGAGYCAGLRSLPRRALPAAPDSCDLR